MPGTWRCPGRDSNSHGREAKDLTDRRVYQFHHPGTTNRNGGHWIPDKTLPAARNQAVESATD